MLGLSDKELRAGLIKLGHKVGPLLPSTRPAYEKIYASLIENLDDDAKVAQEEPASPPARRGPTPKRESTVVKAAG